jgi:hypothetical protein
VLNSSMAKAHGKATHNQCWSDDRERHLENGEQGWPTASQSSAPDIGKRIYCQNRSSTCLLLHPHCQRQWYTHRNHTRDMRQVSAKHCISTDNV